MVALPGVVLEEVANKRQAMVKILRVLNDLAVCKDMVVTTPEKSRAGTT
jgi:hypothetical protein